VVVIFRDVPFSLGSFKVFSWFCKVSTFGKYLKIFSSALVQLGEIRQDIDFNPMNAGLVGRVF
jgi:hypothetical protein